jgi:hypothetical protein
MKPVQCIMGIAIGRKNKPDQASTRSSRGTGFPHSFGPTRREAAVARGRSNRDSLYFPVNSEDAAAWRATAPPANGDVPKRGVCISLLIPRWPLNRPGEDAPKCDGLYFSVNSREEAVGADACRRLRYPADAQGIEPDLHCKSLQIVADTHAAAVGQSFGAQASLLREIAAAA